MTSSYSECSSTSSHPTNRAPIPPHVGPFEYHPAVMCKGGAKAARWISWGVDNPSRRYHKCHNQGAGCNLFDWYDPPSSSFIREPLCRVVAKREKAELEHFVDELRTKEEEQCAEITAARHELAALRLVASKDEAKIIGLKLSRLEKQRSVLLMLLLTCVFMLFVLVLVKN
uniref:Zinc finger GRF-type domain-containing protein n=1 Tax=Oryza meridionalis TaxID=40149 RepID=A0A0E0DGA1_9ORYZ